MARLTIEVVRQAINQLRTQGKNPTNQNIVNCIGYGSFSTLTKLRKLYPDVFGLTSSSQNTLSTVQNTVDDLLVNAVWRRIEPHIDNHVQSVLKQQYSTDNTVQNTLEQVQYDLDQQDKDNAELRTSLDSLRIEKSELICDNSDLKEQLQVRQKALSKLVFLVTTGKIEQMVGNQELGEMIGLSPSDIANLKRKGKNNL